VSIGHAAPCCGQDRFIDTPRFLHDPLPLLLALLLWGIARRVPTIVRGALRLTVALGLVTLVVYFTGEAAEELVEGLPTFAEPLVERHEALALWTTVAVAATGVLAVAAVVRSARSEGNGRQALIRL